MIFRTCPDCGANLDPGESCDCVKEKKLPTTNATASNAQTDNERTVSDYSISDFPEIVKSLDLQELRRKKNLSVKSVIEILRPAFPGFDKVIYSKAENPQKYGITLYYKAMDIFLMKFAPEMLEKEKRRRNGGHKLTATVMCRVDNATHTQLRAAITRDGYSSVQSWLTEIVLNYIKKTEEKENDQTT